MFTANVFSATHANHLRRHAQLALTLSQLKRAEIPLTGLPLFALQDGLEPTTP